MSTETKIQRYSLSSAVGPFKSETGPWVKHADHLAAVEEAKGDIDSVARELTTIIGKPEQQRSGETKAAYVIRRITQMVMKLEAEREEARESALEEAAAVVDALNRSGAYQAIGAAAHIRVLIKRPAEKGEKA